MSYITVTADTEALKHALHFLRGMPEKIPIAMSRALNKSAGTARTDIVRTARENFTIQAARARATVKIFRASASSAEQVVRIYSSERRQAATRFRVTPGAPVSWQGIGNKERKPKVTLTVKHARAFLMRHGFIAKFASGHTGLYFRTGAKTANGRERLTEAYGPAVPQMLGGRTGAEAIAERAAQKMLKELDRQVGVLLEEGA